MKTEKAMETKITYQDFQNALKIINKYQEQIENHYNEVKKETKKISPELNINADNKLVDLLGILLTLRLWNSIRRYGNDIGLEFNYDSFRDLTVKDLANISISKFEKSLNVGPKLIEELKKICFYANVNLHE